MPAFDVMRETTPGQWKWEGLTIQRTAEAAIQWLVAKRPEFAAATLVAQEKRGTK